MKYRLMPIVVDAIQWFKNGDHPEDYTNDSVGLEDGNLRTFTGAYRKEKEWEGSVVRYYRTPDMDGQTPCKHCSVIMHNHGWIDTLERGHIVCPGDWIITGVDNEYYPVKIIYSAQPMIS